MTDTEINGLASQYAESVANSSDCTGHINPDAKYKSVYMTESHKAKTVLQWLSDRFCIVSKDFIRAYHKGHASDIKMLESEPKTGERMMRQSACQLRLDTLNTFFGEDPFTDKPEKQ